MEIFFKILYNIICDFFAEIEVPSGIEMFFQVEAV